MVVDPQVLNEVVNVLAFVAPKEPPLNDHVKPADVSGPDGSVALPVNVTNSPAATLVLFGVRDVTVGGTLFTVKPNVVLVVVVPSSAVIVTGWFCDGPSFVANDQSHVPSAFFVTVPTEADSVTVSSAFASAQVPVLVAD
jgi:hypothetical protein